MKRSIAKRHEAIKPGPSALRFVHVLAGVMCFAFFLPMQAQSPATAFEALRETRLEIQMDEIEGSEAVAPQVLLTALGVDPAISRLYQASEVSGGSEGEWDVTLKLFPGANLVEIWGGQAYVPLERLTPSAQPSEATGHEWMRRFVMYMPAEANMPLRIDLAWLVNRNLRFNDALLQTSFYQGEGQVYTLQVNDVWPRFPQDKIEFTTWKEWENLSAEQKESRWYYPVGPFYNSKANTGVDPGKADPRYGMAYGIMTDELLGENGSLRRQQTLRPQSGQIGNNFSFEAQLAPGSRYAIGVNYFGSNLVRTDMERMRALMFGFEKHNNGVSWADQMTIPTMYQYLPSDNVRVEVSVNEIAVGQSRLETNGNYRPEVATDIFPLVFPEVHNPLLGLNLRDYLHSKKNHHFDGRSLWHVGSVFVHSREGIGGIMVDAQGRRELLPQGTFRTDLIEPDTIYRVKRLYVTGGFGVDSNSGFINISGELNQRIPGARLPSTEIPRVWTSGEPIKLPVGKSLQLRALGWVQESWTFTGVNNAWLRTVQPASRHEDEWDKYGRFLVGNFKIYDYDVGTLEPEHYWQTPIYAAVTNDLMDYIEESNEMEPLPYYLVWGTAFNLGLERVAKVDENGVLTGINPGKLKVFAVSYGGYPPSELTALERAPLTDVFGVNDSEPIEVEIVPCVSWSELSVAEDSRLSTHSNGPEQGRYQGGIDLARLEAQSWEPGKDLRFSIVKWEPEEGQGPQVDPILDGPKLGVNPNFPLYEENVSWLMAGAARGKVTVMAYTVPFESGDGSAVDEECASETWTFLIGECDTCQDSCLAASASGSNESLRLKIADGMGTYLELHRTVPSLDLTSPSALHYPFRHAGVDVMRRRMDVQTGTPAAVNSQTLYALRQEEPLTTRQAPQSASNLGAMTLTQISGPDRLLDIKVVNKWAYEVRAFRQEILSGERDPATGGLLIIGGSQSDEPEPEKVVRVENPNPTLYPNNERIRVTERHGAVVSRRMEFRYNAENGTWDLQEGYDPLTDTALRTETLRRGAERGGANPRFTRLRTVSNSDGSLASQTLEVDEKFPFGIRPVRYVNDPDGRALTTEYTYYDVVGEPGYGQVKQVVNADGSWVRYTYDAQGRRLKVIRPWLNSAITDMNESHHVVTEYGYASVDFQNDDGQRLPRAARTVIEKTLGLETARQYRVIGTDFDRYITAASPGAPWNGSDNLVTTTHFETTHPFNGQPKRVQHEDGTLSTYVHEEQNRFQFDSYLKTITMESGAPNVAGTAVVDGMRSVSKMNRHGHTVEQSSYDVASGLLVSDTRFFDTDGDLRIDRVEYHDGTVSSFNYSCCGLESQTDRQGVTTSFTYDLMQRVKTSTRFDLLPETSGAPIQGVTMETILDAVGRSLETWRIGTDGSSIRVSATEFNNAGELTDSWDALGRHSQFSTEYLPGGGTRYTTLLPDGSAIASVSAADGRILESSGSGTHPVKYAYSVEGFNGGGRMVTREIRPARVGAPEALGGSAPFSYAETEWVESVSDFLGRAHITRFPDGASASVSYNNKGQLVSSIDPDGVTSLMAYNAKGERTVMALDLNRNGVIDFMGEDRITRTEGTYVNDPANGVIYRGTSSVWNETGEEVFSISESSTDGLDAWTTVYGLTTHTQVINDAQNGTRTVSSLMPDNTMQVAVSVFGRVQAVTTSNPGITNAAGGILSHVTYGYDAHGRQNTVTDSRNGMTTITFYDDDQTASVQTPDPDELESGEGNDAQVSAFYYDAMGRLQTQALADSSTIHREYHRTGELKKEYGSQTYPTEFGYDNQGRLETLTTWQDYDTATGAGLAGAAITHWVRDAQRGWLLQKRYDAKADGSFTAGPVYSYTGGGRPQTRTWARDGGTQVTTYVSAFEPTNFSGDIRQVTYADTGTHAVDYTYDRQGRLKTITDAAGVRTLAYEQGRLKSESYAGGPFDGYVLARSYDGLQRYSGLTVGAIDYHVSYGYDAASRLQTVWWGEAGGAGVPSFTYAYHPHSSLVYTLKANNGAEDVLTTTKFWDKLNRLTSVSASSIGPDSELLYAYTHNDLNQRTQAVREDGRYWDYAYDDRGQVTLGQKKSSGGSVLAGFDFGYDYDFIGNRKSAETNYQAQVYEANALNQYTAITGLGTLAHDDDGNLTASGAGWAYEYDGENRLISAESATTRLEHYYDGQSRRFATEEYGVVGVGNYQLLTTTYYLFDGWNLIHEQSVVHGSPIATAKRYLWGLDVSGSLQGAGGVGGLLAMSDEESGALAAYAYDGNGNVSRLYDLANGAVVANYEYDPFGNTISQSGPLATANPFRFSTKYLDKSGLYYYGYRFYSPELGRWLNRDPIGEAGGVSLYGFVGNNGVNGWDLWGLWTVAPAATGTNSLMQQLASEGEAILAREAAIKTGVIGFLGAASVVTGYLQYKAYFEPLIEEDSRQEWTRVNQNIADLRRQTIKDKVEYVSLRNTALVEDSQIELAASSNIEAVKKEAKCKNKCLYFWVPYQRGGGPATPHNVYAASLQGGRKEEVTIVAPEGFTANYDAGVPRDPPKILYEAKTRHGFIENVNEFSPAYLSRLVRFTWQHAVASHCNIEYVIAVDNIFGANALREKFPGFPIYYIP